MKRANSTAKPWIRFSATRPPAGTLRPQLAELLRFARDGDTAVVHSMDRFARDLDDLRALVQALPQRRARGVHQGTPGLHRRGLPLGKLMLSVMGALAEFERAPIKERQREGIALTQQRGAYHGRKTLTPERAAARPGRAGPDGSLSRAAARSTQDRPHSPRSGTNVAASGPCSRMRRRYSDGVKPLKRRKARIRWGWS